MALPQGNVIVEVPHTTTAKQGSPSSHMQPIHETIFARDTSTPPLQVVPPTVPSCASTRLKSKNVPQSSLGPVAPFVANLRGQALPRQSTIAVGPRRPMLSCDVEGAPTNNIDNGNERFLPFVHLDGLGIQERMGLEEMSRSKPSELKAPLDLLKTK
jgi:hypothetical protein